MDRRARQLLRPRRLLVALAIALLASTVGVTVAATQHVVPPVPPSFVDVPAPHVGDRGAYNLTLTGQWLYQDHAPGVPFAGFTFERGADEPLRDGAGRMRLASPIREHGVHYDPRSPAWDGDVVKQGPAWSQQNETYWTDPSDGTALLARGSSDGRVTVQNQTVALAVPFARSDVYHADSRAYGREGDDTSACLVGESIVGRHGNASFFLESCPFDLFGTWRSHGVLFRPDGIETVAGIQAMRYVAAQHSDGFNATIWLADGLPVPLRYQETEPVDQGWNTSERGLGTFRFDLVAFERGASSLPATPPAGDALPPLRRLHRVPSGLNETGYAGTFPASLAFAQAKENKQVAAFLQRHPTAYVARGDLSGWVEPNTRDRYWFLTLSDGTAQMDLWVHETAKVRSTPDNPVLPSYGVQTLAEDFAPQVPEALMDVSYNVTPIQQWDGSRSYPVPANLPASLPSLPGLLDRLQMYTGMVPQGPEDVQWGFDLMCGDSDCATTRVNVNVGLLHLDRRMLALDSSPPGRLFGMDFLDAGVGYDGELAYYSMVGNSTSRSGPMAAPAQAAPAAQDAHRLSAPGVPGAWVRPVAVATGTGLLLSLAYLLWPLLRAGPLALFSRVRGEDLLRNPLRREIHQRIEAEPGIHHTALVRATGRGHGAVEHHLHKLVEASLVTRVQGTGFTCYFPKGTGARVRAAAPALKSQVARAILEAVRTTPGIRSADVARQLAVSPATVSYHVERLRTAGLVSGTLANGALRLQATAPTPAAA